MSDERHSDRGLRDQLRASNERMREDAARRREESERNARRAEALEAAMHAFAGAIGSVYTRSHEATWQSKPFDPAPYIPEVAARLEELLNVVRQTDRLAVLDGMDLDLTFNHYRSSAFGGYPVELARQALGFAVRRLRGAIEEKPSACQELVRELFFDESTDPAGKWFRMLLLMLAGELRYEPKPKADKAGSERCQGVKDTQIGDVALWEGVETDPTTRPFIQVASDVPDLGKADSLPEFWEWCNRRREGLRQFRIRLGLPPPAQVATDEFRVIPEIVRQCRSYLLGFGETGIPDRFAFSRLPYDQTPTGPAHFPSAIEAFLVWAEGYRAPSHGMMELIGKIEDFLSWAMGWCQEQQRAAHEQMPRAEHAGKPINPVLEMGNSAAKDVFDQRQPGRTGQPKTAENIDVGIVIALKEEFQELMDQLDERYQAVPDASTGRAFYVFERQSNDPSAPYRCVSTFVGEMGPTKAALVTEHLLNQWNPAAVVMLGIAGALDKDLSVGDVLVATVVDNYLDRAKAVAGQEPDSFQLELAGDPYRPNAELIHRLSHLEFSHPDVFRRWRQSCANQMKSLLKPRKRTQLIRKQLLRETVTLKEGHIACGPIVGAAEQFTAWLKQRDRSYMAIEMESAGLLTALFEAVDPKRSLILRGISDYADNRKKELDDVQRGALRRYAMRNALALLWALLEIGPLPRRE
jgi:nucleoside phosphorylase